MADRKLDVHVHDTNIGISQDDPRDPSFEREIYGGLIRHLQNRGWSIGPDPRTLKHYRSLSSHLRPGACGELRATIRLGGRSAEIEVWAETWMSVNRNGHRYDFDKLKKMDFLTRLRFELLKRRILAWLAKRAVVSISDSNKDGIYAPIGPGAQTALQAIEQDYAHSPHTNKTRGRPLCDSAYNYRSADGARIEHGATVWFAERKGRIGRGTACRNINSMRWVVAGPYERLYLSAGEIFMAPPANLRRKRNERARHKCLEAELYRATATMAFGRAELLRRTLFGDQPVYLIWSSKNSAYYGPNCGGYASNALSAGKYTREEAESEVRHVPHLLSARGLDGSPLLIDASAIPATAPVREVALG